MLSTLPISTPMHGEGPGIQTFQIPGPSPCDQHEAGLDPKAAFSDELSQDSKPEILEGSWQLKATIALKGETEAGPKVLRGQT